jgi:hypothetical protein
MSNFDPALESLANRFKSWRKEKIHVKYPQFFWDEICNLAKSIPIQTIAKALDVSASYLKIRVTKLNQESVTFTPVKISCQNSFSIEFQSKNDKPITIRFQASTEELAHLIQSLS